jgi:hypothetical protein
VDWLCRPETGRKWYVLAGARTYLTVLGWALSVIEGIQTVMPKPISKPFAPLSPLERRPEGFPAGIR